jgi:hypothetical protein
MVAPPFDAGAAKAMAAMPFPAVADTAVGALGAAAELAVAGTPLSEPPHPASTRAAARTAKEYVR